MSLNEASRVMCTTEVTLRVPLWATCFRVGAFAATFFTGLAAAVFAGAFTAAALTGRALTAGFFTARVLAATLATAALTVSTGVLVGVALLVAMLDFFPECCIRPMDQCMAAVQDEVSRGVSREDNLTRVLI